MIRRLDFWRQQGGAAAAEFALVLPVFFALILGVINVSLLAYFNANLHFAVDDAARCMSVNPAVVTHSCSSSASTQSHALANFNYPSLNPSFTAVSASCGDKVSGTANFNVNAVVISVPVTLSATSCFPLQD